MVLRGFAAFAVVGAVRGLVCEGEAWWRQWTYSRDGSESLEALLTGLHGRVAKSGKHRKVVLFKTHKTGTGTLQGIFGRFAIEHGCVTVESHFNVGNQFWSDALCPQNARVPSELRGTFDMSFRHVTNYRTHASTKCRKWPSERLWFEDFVRLCRLLMGDDVALVLPTRSPESHLQSMIDYYPLREREFVEDHDLWNPLSLDFQITSREDLDTFLKDHLPSPDALGKSGSHVLVLERLAESLVVLRRRLGWSLVDVLPLTMMNSKLHPGTNRAQAKSRDQILDLDHGLYEALNNTFSLTVKAVDDACADEPAALAVADEAAFLLKLSRAVDDVCHQRHQHLIATRGNGVERFNLPHKPTYAIVRQWANNTLLKNFCNVTTWNTWDEFPWGDVRPERYKSH